MMARSPISLLAFGLCVAFALLSLVHAQQVHSLSYEERAGEAAGSSEAVLFNSSIPGEGESEVPFVCWPEGHVNGSVPKLHSDKDPDPLCMVIGNTTKAVFYPQLDRFTLLELDGSVNESYAQNTTLFLEMDGVRSPLVKLWRNIGNEEEGDRHVVIPFMTALINVQDGVVSSIEWDDGCYACSKDLCIDGKHCAIDMAECDIDDCDIKVYIGWQGKTSDGVYLLSAGMKPSAFRKWSLGSLYKEARSRISDNAPTFPTADPDQQASFVGLAVQAARWADSVILPALEWIDRIVLG